MYKYAEAFTMKTVMPSQACYMETFAVGILAKETDLFSDLSFFLSKVFDVQRKITYKNLANWYKELREYRPEIPCCVVANKIDGGFDYNIAHKSECLVF